MHETAKLRDLGTGCRPAAACPQQRFTAVSYYNLIIGILCVWRVTHLFYAEDGPWDLLVRLRKRAGTRFWGDLLDCFSCLSLWISVPFSLLLARSWTERLLLWLALSAGAIILERISDRLQPILPAAYVEDKEDERGMLWQGQGSAQGHASRPTDS